MFSLVLVGGLLVGQSGAPDNLDFSRGSLAGWDGAGFYLTTSNPLGPRGTFGVCSSDAGSTQRQGMLRCVFTVPEEAGLLRFQAYAATGAGVDADARLDVVLAGADQRTLPRKVKTSAGWTSAPRLLPRWMNRPREYCWDLTGRAGELLQIVLIDHDARPGHHVYAAGFRLEGMQRFEDGDFAAFMIALQKKHNLPPLARYDSKRFTALSTAPEAFAVARLRNCEIFYNQFLDHFRDKGFQVHQPRQRLMLALFEGPAGFEAYLGRTMPASIAGIYHTPTNRLVLYDLGENRAFLAGKDKALGKATLFKNSLEKTRYLETIQRQAGDYARDANLSTTMHEAAHLMAFNCGLLERHGDNPAWLVEGMACYCEATEQGDWVALGAINPMRIRELVRARGKYLPLAELVADDEALQHHSVLLGYAQSWALFHLLMHEEPARLRAYVASVRSGRAPEDRLRAFRESFGDLPALQARHFSAMNELVKSHASQKSL